MKFTVGQKVKRNPVHFKSAAMTPTWVGIIIECTRAGYRVRKPGDPYVCLYAEKELVPAK